MNSAQSGMILILLIALVIFFGVSSGSSMIYALSPSTDRPQLNVSVGCMVGSAIIPASFNASNFPPNVHVGIVIQSLSEVHTNTSVVSQFTGLHNDMTDPLGNIVGEFNIDTRIGPYENYSLHVFTDSNRNDFPDSPLELSSSPIIC
jgi:hypothetical protein